jgi:D-alanine-D-alanine ligase-like ATP-grasp enzyme
MIRFALISSFILASLRYRVAPWRFFQLNQDYFNEEKGIFSKLELDSVIPFFWRLHQEVDDGVSMPQAYPVFVKPEWGQNSYAVSRADSAKMLAEIRHRNRSIKAVFLLQQAARGRREFEIFYIRSAEQFDYCSILSITETICNSGERYPIHSVLNPQSEYRDLTAQVNESELKRIWSHLESIGRFRIARVGLRADSLEAMFDGNFQVVEINIFLPMPLMLLDKKTKWKEKYHFIFKSMAAAAKMIMTLPSRQHDKRIFFRKVRAHYRVKP